jgi:hypothetical protein
MSIRPSQPARIPAASVPAGNAPAQPAAAPAASVDGVDPGGTAAPLPGRAASNAQTREVLQTFFAPYDDPIQQDLACIREVLAARRADPRTFPDGENPYKINYAVYNLRNPEVVKLLGEAHQAGVKVQIIIESDQLDPARTWNTADEELAAAGLKVAHSHKGLTAEQRRDINLIGIEAAGFMHLKTRLFERPNPDGGPPLRKLLTGSMNPGDEAAGNDETLHLITDSQLIDRYRAKYDSVLNGTPLANTWKEGAPINVLFSPNTQGPQPADKILRLIDQEKEAIFMSVFSLRDIKSPSEQEGMLEKLKKAVDRGVKVVIITDRKQSDGVDAAGARITPDDPTEDRLRAMGIPVYECINEAGPFNAMHNKSAVFGLTDMKVVTDCGNWTGAAMGNARKKAVNEESLLFIESGKLDQNATGMRYLSNFLNLLRTYEHQQTQAPRADAILNDLMQMPAWPRVKVDFNAVATTHFGQEVYLTGNHPALGSWNREGPGIRMNTTGGTYPLWKADTSIELPFGLAVEYKLVKRDSQGNVDWQGGANQLLIVDSGDIRNAGVDVAGRRLPTTTTFR